MEEVTVFCKNAGHLRVLRYQSLMDEYVSKPNVELIHQGLMDSESRIYYVVFRSAEYFYQLHGRYPGEIKTDQGTLDHRTEVLAEEQTRFMEATKSFLATLNITDIPTRLGDVVGEWCRYGHAELHNVAALMGGMAAQEVIKLITHQYIPMNSTCIYDGIHGVTQTFQL
jgi:amyloid beta precursor protein binding protein 1